MTKSPIDLPGLTVTLDNLIYRHDPGNTPAGTPHIFVYFLTIINESPLAITLLGRKWVIHNQDGETLVIEGEKIVGETPSLQTGEKFSYNSFHLTAGDAVAQGSFHGVTGDGLPIHTRTPPIVMRIPSQPQTP